MPVQFYIKISNEIKTEKILNKEMKQQLEKFKACFKLLEDFKKNFETENDLTKYGNNEEIYITQHGKLNEYNFREKTVKKNLIKGS